MVFLSACGSGGSSGNSGGTGGGTPPTPSTANTSLPYYMPMAQGNTWTFSTGGKIVDLGSLSASACGCSATTMERLALYGPGSSTISGSFFFTKNTPSGQTQLTNILGVENDAGTTNITFFPAVTYPYGLPIMDDVPTVNEFWNDGAGDVSTITSVGGTMSLGSGSIVDDIAADQVTSAANPVTWSFAKGVGFTDIGVSGQSIQMSSFSVNAQNSSSLTRQSEISREVRGRAGRPDVERTLRALFAK